MKRIKDAIAYAINHQTQDDQPVTVCPYAHFGPSFVRNELNGAMLERFQEHLHTCDCCAGMVDALLAQAEATPVWQRLGERLVRSAAVLITPIGISGPVLATPATRSGPGDGTDSDFFSSTIDLPDHSILNVTVVRHRNGRRTITLVPQGPGSQHTYALTADGRLVKQLKSDDGMAFEMPEGPFKLILDGTTVIPFEVWAQED